MSVIALSHHLGPVPLDVVVREQHKSSLAITTNPVEHGADVTDHSYVKPKRLTLEAVIGEHGDGIAAACGQSRPSAAYQALVALQASRAPFDIVTSLTVYESMLIESISVDRDVKTGRVLWFTADLLEVVLVDTEYTSGSQRLRKGSLKGEAADRGAPPADRGNVEAPEAPTDGESAEAENNRSWLKSVFG